MPIGAGKYDDVCSEVREKTKARGAAVIIIDGTLGSGFSLQAPPEVALALPRILRDMANQIEESGG